jgi:hypothetical protein
MWRYDAPEVKEGVMGLFDMWRQARGTVMRKELDDVMARVRAANPHALSAFYNNVEQTIEPLRGAYRPGSTAERKAILKECHRSATEMWNSGDWPSALGLGISALNIESEYVPGKDAAYVKAETDKIIQQATAFFEKRSG